MFAKIRAQCFKTWLIYADLGLKRLFQKDLSLNKQIPKIQPQKSIDCKQFLRILRTFLDIQWMKSILRYTMYWKTLQLRSLSVMEIFCIIYWLYKNFNYQCIIHTLRFMHLKSLARWINIEWLWNLLETKNQKLHMLWMEKQFCF